MVSSECERVEKTVMQLKIIMIFIVQNQAQLTLNDEVEFTASR